MILVRDILTEIADHVGGHGYRIDCSDQAENIALKVFNEAQRILMRRGDWEGTDREICLTIRDSCVTLDRRIETIKQFVFGNMAGQVFSDTFKYLQQGPGPGSISDWFCGSILEDAGDTFPLFCDLPRPMHILAFSDRPEFDNQFLEIHGTDENGREISRYNQAGKGFKIPIKDESFYTSDDAYCSGKVAHVAALRKPRTSGYVYVYGFIPGNTPVWLTTIAPDETNPQHRRYKVPGASDDQCFRMLAKVSMRWVKQYPDDVALIQNEDAFILMAKALNEREAGRYGDFAHLRNAALSELKHQRAKKHPANSLTLNVRMPRNKMRNSSTRFHRYGTYSRAGVQSLPSTANYPTVSPQESTCGTVTVTQVVTCETEVSTVTETAAVDISGHRLVYINEDGNIEPAAPDTAAAEGIIRDAVSEGEQATVYQVGIVTGFSGLDEGETYFLGAGGIPTLTPPTEGWLQRIGTASSETTMLIQIDEPTYIE